MAYIGLEMTWLPIDLEMTWLHIVLEMNLLPIGIAMIDFAAYWQWNALATIGQEMTLMPI